MLASFLNNLGFFVAGAAVLGGIVFVAVIVFVIKNPMIK